MSVVITGLRMNGSAIFMLDDPQKINSNDGGTKARIKSGNKGSFFQ